MDFGVVSHAHKQLPPSSEENPYHGSVPDLKHQRSGLPQDTTWRLPKMPRPPEPDFPCRKPAHAQHTLWSDDGHKMLSFSSSQPAPAMAARSITFSTSQDDPHRNSNGGASTQVMRGPFARLRGPFTPSQWMELEHQALIYKHLVANVPVPSNLLLPLRRSISSYAAPGSYASNFLGWGPFHLGFSSSNDPEPGRCRRTDGKKWRCSRDAVPDQKYCERHINRGRHRSRKPVEGQNGHTVAGSTTSKVAPVASSSSASVMSSSSASISLGAIQGQLGSLQSSTVGTYTDHIVTRSQGIEGGLSLLQRTGGLKSKEVAFSLQKQQLPFEELSNSDFGRTSSDSLLNPFERIRYMDNCYSGSFLQSNAKEVKRQHPLHQFIDNWPNDQSHHALGSWSEELKSDWTQLSMSIPIAADFSSASSSPVQEKSTISTPRPSHEQDRTFHMSLGMNHDDHHGEPMQKQSSWLPVVWENSMGGPLGEVFTSTMTASTGAGEDLLTMKAWKSKPPQAGSSPIGVLHKSKAKVDDKNPTENSHLCNELLGSALTNSAAIPSQ